MRRIVFGFMGTVSALVLLFSYHTSLRSSSAPASVAAPLVLPTPITNSESPSTSPSTSPPAGSTKSAGASGTYTGDAANTQWGVVQVKITVRNGKITKSEAVQYPSGNPRDQQINAYALPQLNSEVVAQQSGSIDTVSGATVTSDGYLQSVQSAIDQAHL